MLRVALIMFAALTLVTGVIYPLSVTIVAQLLFHEASQGSIVSRNGVVLGSLLIGQDSNSPRFFWGRPSATGPMPYNAAASSGSNLAPTNPALKEAVMERVAELRAANPDQHGAIPVDLVTSSASGLDPHISPAAAYYQVDRIARVRQLPAASIRALVEQQIEGRFLGVFGEPRVNVLMLNLALEDLKRQTPRS